MAIIWLRKWLSGNAAILWKKRRRENVISRKCYIRINWSFCDNSEDCEDVESAIEEIGQIAEFLASDPQYAMPIVESGLVSNLIRSMEYCMNSSDATREVIHAFRQLGKIDEEAKLQCVTEGVIRPIIMGMNHHRNDTKVQAAGAHALGVYAKENPTVAQNILDCMVPKSPSSP